MHSRRLQPTAAMLALLALVLGACSPFGGSSSDAGGDDGGGGDEGEEFADGPAPAGWNDRAAIRVDRVTVEGSALEMEITINTRRELSFDESDIRLVTNNGLELPRSAERDRTLTSYSAGTITVATDGLVEPARSVELSFPRLPRFDVDLPDGDGELRWAPAPLRQMAFEDTVVRNRSLSMLPYTFRSEGLVSEFTFLAVTRTRAYQADICDSDNRCRLQDSAGREYPRIGSGYDNKRSDIQVRGTLRFLGQIPPNETDLILVIRDLEIPISLPPGEDTALSVAHRYNVPAPFDVDARFEDEGGFSLEMGEISFYEDRIQLDISATATASNPYRTGDQWELHYIGRGAVRDSSGYRHELMRPAGGVSTNLFSGDTIDMTLVYTTPLDPTANEIEIIVHYTRNRMFRHKIDIAALRSGFGGDDDDDGDDDVADDDPSDDDPSDDRDRAETEDDAAGPDETAETGEDDE